jgi:glutathione S-transferase
MKLFFSPGACSLSPHIALRESGLQFQVEKVDLGTKKTESGQDFNAINPKGYVPALQLEDGSVLTEGPAIVQYIADKAPQAKLAPANGTVDRYRLQEWLNFIGTEIHKNFSYLFGKDEAMKTYARAALTKRFDGLRATFEKGSPFLMGDQFTVADGYLFTVLNWGGFVGLDISQWPYLKDFHARVGARAKVQEALKAEGLMK